VQTRLVSGIETRWSFWEVGSLFVEFVKLVKFVKVALKKFVCTVSVCGMYDFGNVPFIEFW